MLCRLLGRCCAGLNTKASYGSLTLASRALATKSDTKEPAPEIEVSYYSKKFQNPRAEHWRAKFADIRFEYLQDPKVAAGDIVPIIVKDTAERDKVNWPDFKLPDMAGRTRLFLIPEEFFNFLYSKTGVTGPYIILFGSLGYIWSQEWLRHDDETALFLELTLLPLFIYQRIYLPRMWAYRERTAAFEKQAFESMTTAFINNLELQNVSEKISVLQVKNAKGLMFQAKKEMYQLQWESTYRERMFEAYEKVKQRLDFYAELQACKARHQNRHMVNWIVNSVVGSITPEQEKATLDKCIADLKSMATTVKL